MIYDEDIEALVDEEIATVADRIKVVSMMVIAGTLGPAVGDADARHRRRAADRAVDRQRAGGRDLQRDPEARAAQGRARALSGARRHRGHGRPGRGVRAPGRRTGAWSPAKAADPDTLVASAKAYVGALNKLMIIRQRQVVAQARGPDGPRIRGI